jgi:hypothetical protein
LLNTHDVVVFGNIILGCRDGSASAEAVIANRGGRPGAISANVQVIAVVVE